VSMYERILVPVDGSPTSKAGLDEAVKVAKLTGARVRLVHVLQVSMPLGVGLETYTGDVLGLLNEAGAAMMAAEKARVAASGVEVDTFIPDTFGERVCDVVCEQAKLWSADLIVIGTHGRRGVKRFVIGSDAEQIVRAAPVPVLLVRVPKAEGTPEVDAGAASSIPGSAASLPEEVTKAAA